MLFGVHYVKLMVSIFISLLTRLRIPWGLQTCVFLLGACLVFGESAMVDGRAGG